MKILDSCTIIHSDKDYSEGGYVTTSSVLSEMISDTVKLVVDQGVREGFIEIRDPGKECIGRVRAAATETGDITHLSATDIDVLALALELGGELLSDDYGVQNVARKLGVKYVPTVKEGIKGAMTWTKKCPGCHRKYPLEKRVCDVCGTELKRSGKQRKH